MSIEDQMILDNNFETEMKREKRMLENETVLMADKYETTGMSTQDWKDMDKQVQVIKKNPNLFDETEYEDELPPVYIPLHGEEEYDMAKCSLCGGYYNPEMVLVSKYDCSEHHSKSYYEGGAE